MDLPPPTPPVRPLADRGPWRLARATLAGAWAALVLIGIAGILLAITLIACAIVLWIGHQADQHLAAALDAGYGR